MAPKAKAKSKTKAKSRTTKVKSGTKASKKTLLSTSNPCCPIIKVEHRPVFDLSSNRVAGERSKVMFGKKTRQFTDSTAAAKYIEELEKHLDEKRCKVVTDIKEMPGTTMRSIG